MFARAKRIPTVLAFALAALIACLSGDGPDVMSGRHAAEKFRNLFFFKFTVECGFVTTPAQFSMTPFDPDRYYRTGDVDACLSEMQNTSCEALQPLKVLLPTSYDTLLLSLLSCANVEPNQRIDPPYFQGR